MKQAIKKGAGVKRASIDELRGMMGLRTSKDGNEKLETSCAMKPEEWIVMPEAFRKALRIPGFVMGETNVITGWQSTGKSTLKNCAIAACQRQGILPVIFETENHFKWDYAKNLGVQVEDVYGDVEVEDYDEETGEMTGTHIEKMIIDHTGDFLFFDSSILASICGDYDHSQGKRVSKNRGVAVLEDIAYVINDLLDKQNEGIIQQPMCFFWDSVGSIGSYRSFTSKVGNNQFDAGAIEAAFKTILNDRIPSSKKVGSPYTNTCIFVNKIWNSSMQTMGLPSFKNKGGETVEWATRLHIHLGNAGGPGVTKLNATAKGETYFFGTKTKIKVMKNQSADITYEGTICCLHNGIYSESELDKYKKTYAKDLLAKLSELHGGNISESELEFTEEYYDKKD